MDVFIRIMLISAAALLLLSANVWFFRFVNRQMLSPEYVILPFDVLDPAGSADVDKSGKALAQMMAAYLTDIQAKLRAAHEAARQGGQVEEESADPRSITRLFVQHAVNIPASLFEPVSIDVSVGGVEVGGVLSWFQRSLVVERSIRVTTFERSENATVSVDLTGLNLGVSRLVFQSQKHPDEIAANAAYALIQAVLVGKEVGRISDLSVAEFRRLLEVVFEVESLNRRASRGHVVEKDYARLLPVVESQLEGVPSWPELLYLAASIAEGAGNTGKALLFYRKVRDLPVEAVQRARSPIRAWAADRLAALGAAEEPAPIEKEEEFIRVSHEFARKMSLKGSDPQIAFARPQTPGVQALWNTELRRYEVNPEFLGQAGLPQYVALMGRFMEQNFEKCFGSGPAKPAVEVWNDFRYSVVEYLIQTQPGFEGVVTIAPQFKLFRALKSLEEMEGSEPVKRLALELLERFQCDWTYDNLAEKALAINDERGLLPASAVVDALAKNGIPVPDRPS